MITRNGRVVSAVVSIEEYEIIEEVIDEAFSRRADQIKEQEEAGQVGTVAAHTPVAPSIRSRRKSA